MKKILRISIVLLFTTQCVFCLGDRFELSQTLSEITACLEQKETPDTSLVSSREFLSAITNEVNQSEVVDYTSNWVSKYGDSFPESILLHFLAGGNVDIIRHQYNQLNSLVSKHYARWCLMLKDEPLESRIPSREGKYYKSDTLCRTVVRRIDDRITLNGGVYIKRKRWFEHRPIVVHNCEAVILRTDSVPVPWGLYQFPEINYIPFEVPIDIPKSLKSDRTPFNAGSIFATKPAQSIYMLYDTSDDESPLGCQSIKAVWDFFVETLPPLVYIGNQPVSVMKTKGSFFGEIRYLTRILISKEKETEAFYNDSDLEQDILISPPIRYIVEFSGEDPEIKWNIEDVTH